MEITEEDDAKAEGTSQEQTSYQCATARESVLER